MVLNLLNILPQKKTLESSHLSSLLNYIFTLLTVNSGREGFNVLNPVSLFPAVKVNSQAAQHQAPSHLKTKQTQQRTVLTFLLHSCSRFTSTGLIPGFYSYLTVDFYACVAALSIKCLISHIIHRMGQVCSP